MVTKFDDPHAGGFLLRIPGLAWVTTKTPTVRKEGEQSQTVEVLSSSLELLLLLLLLLLSLLLLLLLLLLLPVRVFQLLESQREGRKATVLVLWTPALEERGHWPHTPAPVRLVVPPAARVLAGAKMNEGDFHVLLPLILFPSTLARELDEAAPAAAGVVAIMKVARQAATYI